MKTGRPPLKNALTTKSINKCTPQGTTQFLPDGQGLYLQVAVGGRKTFITKYKCPTTYSQTQVTIGVYPDVSLVQARAANRRIHFIVANDADPKDYKHLFFDEEIENSGAFKHKQQLHELLYTRSLIY